MDKQRDFVLRTIEERGVKFVRLWFTDVVGALKSVAIAPAEVEGAFAEGLGIDGSSIEGFTRAFEADVLAQLLEHPAATAKYDTHLLAVALLALPALQHSLGFRRSFHCRL